MYQRDFSFNKRNSYICMKIASRGIIAEDFPGDTDDGGRNRDIAVHVLATKTCA